MNNRTQTLSRSAERLFALSAGVISALLSFVLFGKAGPDDSYITNWAALSLANSGSITNFNGQIFEQSTSLLHVIVLGAIRFATGLPVPLIGYIVGVLGIILTVFAASEWARRINQRAVISAAVLVAAAYPLLYWGGSGLETPLVPAVLILLLSQFSTWIKKNGERSFSAQLLSLGTLKLGAAALLASLIRPDLMLVILALAATLLVFAVLQDRFSNGLSRVLPQLSRSETGSSLLIIGIAAFIVEIFRFAYFGRLFPAPVYAKTGLSLQISSGWDYIWSSLPSPILWVPTLLFAIVATVSTLRTRSITGWMTVISATYMVAVVLFSGGDWMGWARMLVTPAVLLLILAACGIADTVELRANRSTPADATNRSQRILALALLGTLVVLELSVLALKFNDPRGNGEPYPSAWFAPVWTSWNPSKISGSDNSVKAANLAFYENRNMAHVRDATFVKKLEPELRTLVAKLRKKDPNRIITIASPQAGLIPYYLFQDIPGLKFIDRFGLTTDSFDKCAEVKRSPFGTTITDQFWIANAGKCAPELPDLLIINTVIRPPLDRYYQQLVSSALPLTRAGLDSPYPTLVVAGVNKNDL
jgi:hypothetical protein